MPKTIGNIQTDFFSNLELKFDAFLSELETMEAAIKEADVQKMEKSAKELNKISEFDVVGISTIRKIEELDHE